MTPIERSAWIADQLRAGERLTPRIVAQHTGCKEDTARRMLDKLPRVISVTKIGRVWTHTLFARINTCEGEI